MSASQRDILQTAELKGMLDIPLSSVHSRQPRSVWIARTLLDELPSC